MTLGISYVIFKLSPSKTMGQITSLSTADACLQNSVQYLYLPSLSATEHGISPRPVVGIDVK